MNKEKIVKTLKTDTDLWNRYRRCFSYLTSEVSTLIDLREADLSKVDLSKMDLSKVDLSSANLSSANLIVETRS